MTANKNCASKMCLVFFILLLGSFVFLFPKLGVLFAAPIPEEIKKTVTFIYAPMGDQLKPVGTAFFVSVPHGSDPKQSYVYTVTAKHVLLIDSADPKRGYHPIIFVRVNKRSGEATLVPIFLTGPKAARVFSHQDPAVDIAVVTGAPLDNYESKMLPVSMLATGEHFSKGQIKEGDEAFFVGLFSRFVGAKRNYPIVRFGRLAMVTDEKIPWDGQMLNLYLIETQSFGGNSGSPVFFYPGLERTPGTIVLGGPTILLAGVMMGTFRNLNEILFVEPGKSPKPEKLEGKIPISVENMGIAAVVPAFQLHEILFSDEARDQRLMQR